MKYGKHLGVKRTTRFMAHDEDQICEPGDVVEIRQWGPSLLSALCSLQSPGPTLVIDPIWIS